MRKILIIGIVLIFVFSISCLPAPSSGASSPKAISTATDEAQNKRLDAVESAVAAVKSSSGGVAKTEFDGLANRVGAVENKVNSISVPQVSKSDYDVLAAQVSQLKNEITALKSSGTGGTGTSGSTTPTTGQVTMSTNPTPLNQLFSSGQMYYTLKIMNGTTTWQYVKPFITMSISGGQTATVVTSIEIAMTSGQWVLDCNSNCAQCPCTVAAGCEFSINAGNCGTTTSTIMAIPVLGGSNNSGELQVSPNSFIDLLVTIKLNTSTSVLWNITNSFSSRSL